MQKEQDDVGISMSRELGSIAIHAILLESREYARTFYTAPADGVHDVIDDHCIIHN